MYIDTDPVEYDEAAVIGQCTYCGDPNDYCQGHGEIGDPAGFQALIAHDEGDHSSCHQDGCRFAPKPKHERVRVIATPLGELIGGAYG